MEFCPENGPMRLNPVGLRSCFSAFPDSNVFEVGDQVYNVRVRASTAGLAVSGKCREKRLGRSLKSGGAIPNLY